MNSKRRNYFIDKSFQLRFILKFCIIVAASSVLIGFLIFFLANASTTVAIENTKVTVKSTSDFILPVIVYTLLIVSVFSAVAVSIVTLLVSHKIAGPLYRLKNQIEALKDGNLGINFNIREKDQLQLLAKTLNGMCVSLKQKYSELKDKYKDLNHYLGKKNFCVSEDDKQEIARILEDIDKALNFFKT